MVLHPALGGLRVNDDFHKPPQDGSDFGAGGGSFRVKTVAAFPSQDARLLHGFDFLCRPAADLCVVRKGHSFMGSRQVIAQLFRVICHNDRHLFPGDIGVRGKGGGGGAVYNAFFCRPVHIRGVVGVCFHIGEFPGFVAVRVNACQPPQGGDEHSPRHAGVGAELVVTSTIEQPPAGYKDDVILSPVVLNVCKDRDRVLVADAVDAEMPGFKNNRTQVRVIAGFVSHSTLPLPST